MSSHPLPSLLPPTCGTHSSSTFTPRRALSAASLALRHPSRAHTSPPPFLPPLIPSSPLPTKICYVSQLDARTVPPPYAGGRRGDNVTGWRACDTKATAKQ